MTRPKITRNRKSGMDGFIWVIHLVLEKICPSDLMLISVHHGMLTIVN